MTGKQGRQGKSPRGTKFALLQHDCMAQISFYSSLNHHMVLGCFWCRQPPPEVRRRTCTPRRKSPTCMPLCSWQIRKHGGTSQCPQKLGRPPRQASPMVCDATRPSRGAPLPARPSRALKQLHEGPGHSFSRDPSACPGPEHSSLQWMARHAPVC